MKAQKKIISLLLMLTLIGGLLAVPAAAEEAGAEAGQEQSAAVLLLPDQPEEAAASSGQTDQPEGATASNGQTNQPEEAAASGGQTDQAEEDAASSGQTDQAEEDAASSGQTDQAEEDAASSGQTNQTEEDAASSGQTAGDETDTPENDPDESADPEREEENVACTHQWTENRIEAGCTRAGRVYESCDLCGEQRTVNRLEPLGHDYESSVTRQPTASSAGLRTYTCTVCGKRYTEEIARLTEESSQPAENAQQKGCEHLRRTATGSETATCTQEGRLLSRCLDCGMEGLVMTVIPKLDHSYTSAVTKAATETSEGVRTYTCTVCGSSYTEKIPKLTAAQHQGAWTSGLDSVSKLSRDEISALLAKYPTTMPDVVFDETPNCAAPHRTGKVSSTALNAAADRLNALRQLAGLKPVTLDQEWCDLAQYGAVILGELGDLSHTPKKPADMDSAFYKKAYTATSTSNLYGGEKLTATPDGFMDDSDASNVSRVGHRRWQLNPNAVKVGFGYVDNGTGYRRFTCERVFSSGERSAAQNTDYDFIGWPASGNFPGDTGGFTGTTAWSVSLNPQRFSQPKLGDLTVTIRRESDGRSWTLSGSYSAADSGAYLNVNNGGYGSGYCVIFRPDGVSSYEGVYTVSIDGLRTRQGEAVEDFTYEVDFFNVNADRAADETLKTGPVTETRQDGSVTVTETQANGSVLKTTTTPNGTTAAVTTDARGAVTAASAAVSSAEARSGKTVTLPLESVTAAASSASAAKISVTLPAGSSVRVEFPVKNASDGTVAVLVNGDGTETVLPTTQRTQNGISVKLEGSAAVKIVDCGKQFSDVPSSSVFYHEILSMSARNIMVGKTGKTFDLYANVTRNQIANVAGRISGAVSVTDYAGGIRWAEGRALPTGDQPAARADVLKALYIAADSPQVSDQGQLDKFTDGSSVSAELLNAVLWAVESGVLKGNSDGTLGLNAHVTRGQTAAFAGRALSFMA